MHRGLREALTELTQAQVDRIEQGAWYHSIDLPDGSVIPGLIKVEDQRARFDAFGIPRDLRGKRALDVGAATGWCSFELERRGAEVVAVDCVEYEDFRVAHKLLGSRVDYRLLDMEEMTPERLGVFDYVLFFGVLYHLRHPLLGLERICALTRDTAFVESYVCDGHLPAEERAAGPVTMEFYESDELGGQIDNWVGPTQNCLLALCRSAGFAGVEFKYVADRRAGVACRRQCAQPPEDAGEAPWLNAAINNRTGDLHFHAGKDEYLCLYFNSPEPDLKPASVLLEIDDAGAAPLILIGLGRQGWQANLRVPPGLAAGRHSVRVRTTHSAWSNAVDIVMRDSAEAMAPAPMVLEFGPPETVAAPVLGEVENGTSESVEFRGYRNETLCCRFVWTETRLRREDVAVEVSGRLLPALFLTDRNRDWQTNSKLPPDLADGVHRVRVRTRTSAWSNALEIRVRRS